MRLCICICTCERPAGLARLLKALDQQRLGNLAETALRILIIDNGRSRAAVPVVEAMTACVLADAFLRHRGQTGGGAFSPGGPRS